MASSERIIAIEPRSSKFGFVVLERPDGLLDWGVRSFGEDIGSFKARFSDRIDTLLAFYDPAVVVVRDRTSNSAVRDKRVRKVIGALELIMKPKKSRFRLLTAEEVRDRFAFNGEITKHDIAKSLAERFKELSFRLPNRRKVYQSEAPVMLVFDALATAIAFVESGTS
jgi:hypothetical protein